ncbi:MAG: TetR/AcrR family transcriptional regulator [Acidimicrobiales bacterium]
MARKATRAEEIGASDVAVPEWKLQSVERSLQGARARAQERSDRFVAATIDLMQETGSTDFTVQDVVERSRMSIRTFYKFFASKDDLLVAVHDTILAKEVLPRLRVLCDAETDPVRRIRAYVEGLYGLSRAGPVPRALTTYYNRLAETRPAELDRAFSAQIELVIELVRDAARAQSLRSDLDVEKAAHLLHHAVLAAAHARVLGSESRGVAAEDLWVFCANGIGVDPPATSRGRGTRRRG